MRVAGAHPVARLAEPKERAPRIAVVDDFEKSEGDISHGKQVEDVLVRTGSLDRSQIQNLHNSYETDVSYADVLESEPAELLQKLSDYTEQSVSGLYQATTANLETIESEFTSVRVINQSQGQSPAGLAEPFLNQIMDNDDFRKNLRSSLDLKPRSHKSTVAQGFVDHLSQVWEQSPGIASARDEYLDSAARMYDKGVVHLVTGGSLGEMVDSCEQLGIEMPENAYQSILANQFTTVVGATDTMGTLSLRDDRAAEWSSVSAGVEFSMPGGWDSTEGTAVSVAQVSALVDDMVSTSPTLTVADVETLLYQATVPVRGTPEQVGAGQIDPDRALNLARRTAQLVAANTNSAPKTQPAEPPSEGTPDQSPDGGDLGHLY